MGTEKKVRFLKFKRIALDSNNKHDSKLPFGLRIIRRSDLFRTSFNV